MRSQAQALYSDLRSGRWPRRAHSINCTWKRLAVGRRRDQAGSGIERGGRGAAAMEQWNARARDEGPPNGRESVETDDGPVTILWQGRGDRLAALAVSSGNVGRQRLAPLQGSMQSQGARASFLEMNGRHGGESASRAVARRARQDTGLPWTLLVATTRPAAELEEFAGRRRLLFIGLALIGVLVLAGVYFTVRAVRRELAAARLQSDSWGGLPRVPHAADVAAPAHGNPRPSGRMPTKIAAAVLPGPSRDTAGCTGWSKAARLRAHGGGAREYRFEPLDAARSSARWSRSSSARRGRAGATASSSRPTDGAQGVRRPRGPRAGALEPAGQRGEVLARVPDGVGRNGAEDAAVGHPRAGPRARHPAARSAARSSASSCAAAPATRAQGTGIGLAMVQAHRRGHGGRSRSRASRARQHVHHPVCRRGAGMARILIVEDEPDIASGWRTTCGRRL